MPPDAKPPDAKPPDAKPPDAKPPDAKPPDAKPPDAKPPDAKPPDAKPPDAKPPDAKPPEAAQPVPPPLHQQLLSSLEAFLNDVECASEMFLTVVPILAEKDQERIAKSAQLVAKVTDWAKQYSGRPTKTRLADSGWVVNQLTQTTKLISTIRRAGLLLRAHPTRLL